MLRDLKPPIKINMARWDESSRCEGSQWWDMASDRDSGLPQAPRRAPVHQLDTAHQGATTLARFILSPHRHQATDRGSSTTSAMHIDTARRVLPSPLRQREHRIGPAAIPSSPAS